MSTQYPHNIEHLPDDLPYWMIITNKTIYIPGDERSKRHPGHGYSEENRPILDIEVYINENDLKEEIKKRSLQNKSFKVVKVCPIQIETHVQVELHTIT